MIDRAVVMIRRWVERALPWYDPEERDRRAAHTERLHQRAVAARVKWEQDLASYRRTRLRP